MPYAGPGGERYASVIFPANWPEVGLVLNNLAARFRSHGRPDAALIVERAWSDARREQIVMGQEMAAFATKQLQAWEKKTRVRPDTHGGGGPRLGDYLVAEPMPHQDLLPGAIGVADEELLDNNVPWWVTNEEGNSTLVGRKIFGLFFGAGDAQGVPPDPNERQQHPLFMPAPARAGGGQGIIEHAIPERRFIERALPEIEAEWHARFDAIRARLDAELMRANATFR